MTTTERVLRWIAVAPGAALGAIAAGTLVGVFYWIVDRGPEYSGVSKPGPMWVESVKSAVTAMTFVHLAARIAPSRKRTVACTAAVLQSLLIAVSMGFLLRSSPSDSLPWVDLVSLSCGLIAGIVFAVNVDHDDVAS